VSGFSKVKLAQIGGTGQAMFTPENELERLLMAAATDPAVRPQFYAEFAASTIFMLNDGSAISEQPGPVLIPPGTKIAVHPVQKGERSLLPIFSSLPRLQFFYKHETQFLELRTLDYLSMTRGAEIVLNPGSDYGKEFTASEVTSILDGWKPAKTYVAEEETQVLLGQPANYPYALTEALSRLFSTIKAVDSAYLAQFHNPDQGEPPHTLIGIKTAGDWDTLTAQAGMVLSGVEILNPPVDFVRIDGTGGLEDYLLTTKPFYKRKTFGLF
jgi:hypothetical protein